MDPRPHHCPSSCDCPTCRSPTAGATAHSIDSCQKERDAFQAVLIMPHSQAVRKTPRGPQKTPAALKNPQVFFPDVQLSGRFSTSGTYELWLLSQASPCWPCLDSQLAELDCGGGGWVGRPGLQRPIPLWQLLSSFLCGPARLGPRQHPVDHGHVAVESRRAGSASAAQSPGPW